MDRLHKWEITGAVHADRRFNLGLMLFSLTGYDTKYQSRLHQITSDIEVLHHRAGAYIDLLINNSVIIM